MASLHIKRISTVTISEVLARYSMTVPEKLRDLDAQRYDDIPAAVANRDKSTKHLTKAEVEKLVEWKLKHGTFRPALMSLVQSNTAQAVEETTKKAYTALRDSTRSNSDVMNALKILVGLKGIGPATASLLLSVLQPAEIPFFSDELFRWCCWDNEVKSKEGMGWQRKIKYNIKEYEMLLSEVEKLRTRLSGVKAADMEKVAWVLGKEKTDIDAGKQDDKQAADAKERVKEEALQETKPNKAESSEETPVKPVAKKGTKRKAASIKPPAEGTRKSARTKR